MPATVNLSVSDGVATIELNRPAVSNSIDQPTAELLAEIVRQVEADAAVRAVLLTGAGPRFCSGGDLAAMHSAENPPEYLGTLARTLNGAIHSIEQLRKPVVSAVQGAVAGAGIALMLSSDVIIAEPSTKFVFAFPNVGLVPDSGTSYLLPRAIGQQRALRFALEGKPMRVPEAVSIGLVSQEAAEGEALDTARALAEQWASGPAEALGHSRALLRQNLDSDRTIAGDRETAAIIERVRGPEATRLMGEFLNR